MQANSSLVVNLILYISAFVGMGYCIKMLVQFSGKHFQTTRPRKNSLIHAKGLSVRQKKRLLPEEGSDTALYNDDIIAVRKVALSSPADALVSATETPVTFKFSAPIKATKPSSNNLKKHAQTEEAQMKKAQSKVEQNLMMFLLSKEKRPLKGYEVLQTILAIGLRFGEGDLFHRYEETHKQGPKFEAQSILCSLATATETGSFDLNNMGAFQAKGLCLFMSVSGNVTIDSARFNALYQTALQLRDGLDVHLLDDRRQPLGEESFKNYAALLNNKALCDLYEPRDLVTA